MSIKKSLIESKWYYRFINVFLNVLPFIIIAVLYNRGYIVFKDLFKTDITDFLEKNSAVLIYLLVGITAYYVILAMIAYVIFGGVEDDIKNKKVAAEKSTHPVQPVAGVTTSDGGAAVVNYLKETERKKSEAVTWIILIILFIWIAVYYNTPSSSTTGVSGVKTKTSTSTCIPTGCGTNWQCSGTYYSSSGAQKSISGCYTSANKNQVTSLNSWSGICRQCPY